MGTFPCVSAIFATFKYITLPGTEFMDTVTIAPGVVIPSQSIGVASTFRGIKDVDGILG
jgi:cathepsin E